MDDLSDLDGLDLDGPTPVRAFLADAARRRVERFATLRDTLGRPPVALIAGCSVKTNPRAELLRLAHEHGFFAETITRDEREWTAALGFGSDRTIANGPEPIAPRADAEPLAFAFADSIEAVVRNAALRVARIDGVRLRPAMVASRFGVPVEDDERLRSALAASRAETPLGVSFHARREDYAGASWRDVAGDVLERAVRLGRACGRPVVAFDAGGGWTPEEFDRDFVPDIRWLVDRLVAALPSCRTLIVEPGQALATPLEALVTTVLEVRARPGRREAIVDLAYADWPQMHAYVHRLFVRRGDRWVRLGRGGDRLGGRTCLEYDLVEGLRFPDDLAAGDRIAVADCGSYDHAMAFAFARGEGAAEGDGSFPPARVGHM